MAINRRMFAKRHYEAMAATLKSQKPNAPPGTDAYAQWMRTVNAFVAMCNADNFGMFKPDYFRIACGCVEE